MTTQFEHHSTTVEDKKIPTHEEQKKIDKVAEEAALKASKTEQKYDQDQSIFTK